MTKRTIVRRIADELGRTANGWIEWKTEDGKTLNAARRANTSEQSDDADE
jgi:hypothetical protein